MMKLMIENEDSEGFESFLETPSRLVTPVLATPFEENPLLYKCGDLNIEDVGYKKRGFWCFPKQFKKASGDTGDMAGFFCSSTRQSKNRYFAYRAPGVYHTAGVKPVAQMYSDGKF